MVETDLRGVDSHGVSTLLGYHRLLRAGNLEPRPEVRTVSRDQATAVVDGGGGLGHVPAETGMRLAIELAREAGTGTVAVRNSGHFGAAGIYAAMAAEAGHDRDRLHRHPRVRRWCPPTARRQSSGPTRSRSRRPAATDRRSSWTWPPPPRRWDACWERGAGACECRAGWALRADGRPERDGRRAFEGRRLTPLGASPAMGSYKGYGLAAMVEILCGGAPR